MQLRLLGTLEVNLEGKSVAGTLSKKAQAILVYLGMSGRPQSRAFLATLLWGDMPDASARTNLRKALALLRQELTPYLQIERQSVAFAPEAELRVDAVEFEALINAASSPINAEQLQTAVNLYHGDFLTGFYVNNAPDFEAWMLSEQARLRELMIVALHTLTTHFAKHGELSRGIAAARHLLNLEPWREEAHRQLMRLLAQDGQRGAALAQYETCRKTLAEELSVEPGRETVALYERIRDDVLVPNVGTEVEIPETADETGTPKSQRLDSTISQAHHVTAVLPAQPTPFVGRTAELAEIIRRLNHPDCRLLTLVGPGGIGKTRLAIQTGHLLCEEQAQTDHFSDGILFVPLAPVSTSGGLVSAIAEAANFHFYSNVPPRQQLLDYLRGKELLLILDNFEHLLPEATLISDILTAAPAVKVLVTSIESLSLQEEWIHPIAGLPYPQDADLVMQQVTNYDAVRLFAQSARRIRIDFSLENEAKAVTEICRLVEGMPLGIELAAAWLKVLPAEKIAREIEKSIDFLATRQQNVKERHRSIRAVFEYSWQLLTQQEQIVFKRLSVFRGSFDQNAAEQIADASLPTLAVLVEKSLLRVTETARYQLHELLRKFAAAKLAEDSPTALATREKHSTYYLDFLQAHEAMLTSREQKTAVAKIAEESDNVREAWLWAADQGNLASIAQTLTSYFNFFLVSSQFHQGEETFSRLLDHLQESRERLEYPQHDEVRARALIRYSAFCYFLGDYEQASQCAEEGLQIEVATEQQSDVAFGYLVLGAVAGWQGNKELAQKRFHQSLAISQEIGDEENMADALHELAQLHGSFGNYAEAKRLAQESLAISRVYGRPDWIAHALVSLGWATVCLGEYVDAEAHYREALALYEMIGSQHGVSSARDSLGWVAWCQGGERLISAGNYFRQSLSDSRQTGFRLLISNTLGDLALLANETGDYIQAQEYSREGLQLAKEVGSSIYTSYHLCCLGGATCGLGAYEEGRRYLLEALQIAYDVQLAPTIYLILFSFANLLVKECEVPGTDQSTILQMKIQALQLVAMIIQDPVTWQGVRDRAKNLQAELEAELPAETAATAVTQGQNQTADKVVVELLQAGQL